jgi:hypothetical protein
MVRATQAQLDQEQRKWDENKAKSVINRAKLVQPGSDDPNGKGAKGGKRGLRVGAKEANPAKDPPWPCHHLPPTPPTRPLPPISQRSPPWTTPSIPPFLPRTTSIPTPILLSRPKLSRPNPTRPNGNSPISPSNLLDPLSPPTSWTSSLSPLHPQPRTPALTNTADTAALAENYSRVINNTRATPVVKPDA